MPLALKLRQLRPEEQATIENFAHSRTASVRLVERARLSQRAYHGHRVPAIAQPLQLTASTVRTWLKRFTAAGLAALTAKPRSGRPATYTPPQGAAWIAPALTPPEHRGLPFASWTRERLEACLHAHKGMAITRSRLEELLIAEGLRWRTHAPGLGERVEPAFAPKRGGLPHSTPPHLQGGA